MAITEHTLKNWRRQALKDVIGVNLTSQGPVEDVKVLSLMINQLSERILRLTQELLDQYLIQPRR